MNKAVKRQK